MLSSARLSVLSLMIVALGGTSLLAAPRRAETCYLLQQRLPGTCPSDLEGACTSVGSGCPAEPTGYNCQPVNQGEYLLSCCFNGNKTGACAPPP